MQGCFHSLIALSISEKGNDMAVCKRCPTILRSGNKTGYCSVCAPPDKEEDKMRHKPFFSYAKEGEMKQWDRLLVKIRIEVASIFNTTVSVLEGKQMNAYSAPQLAIQHILADFFKVSISDVVRFGKISREVVTRMRDEAETLHRYDADFQEKCEEVRVALKTMDRDILPRCADHTAIPLQQETYEEREPYVRFTQIVARPAGGPMRMTREADTVS